MKLVPALSQHAEKFPFCVTLVANRALFRRRHAWLHLRAKVQVFQGNFNFVNPVELFSFVPGEKKIRELLPGGLSGGKRCRFL